MESSLVISLLIALHQALSTGSLSVSLSELPLLAAPYRRAAGLQQPATIAV